MKMKKLGQLTAKMATGQLQYGGQNPFAQDGMGLFSDGPPIRPMPQPMAPQGGMPGSPGQDLAAQTSGEEYKPKFYGDGGAGSNRFFGALEAGAALNPATAPLTLPVNAAIEGIGYLRGKAPSMPEIENVRTHLGVDPNKDSYLTAGDKLLQGTGWAVTHPISGMRMIANDANQAFANDPSYKWMKGKAQGAGNWIGNTYNQARQGMGYAYDQFANVPMNQAGKQPMKPMAPAPKPAAPAPTIGAPPKPLAPAAPKPVQSTMPGAKLPGV